MSFKVQKRQCNQCLFSENRVVSQKRAESIIKECIRDDTFFQCHKGTLKNQDICCRGFWDNFKDRFNLGRVVQRIGGPQFVEVKD